MVLIITMIRVASSVLVISTFSALLLLTSCVPLEEDSVTSVSGPTSSDNSTPDSTSDTTAPTVSSYSPLESGATSVSNIVSISFSEEMDTSTINSNNIVIYETSDSSKTNLFNTVTSSGDVTFDITPSSNFNSSSNYTVVVRTGVTDKAEIV